MRPRDSERNTSEWTRSKGMWGERYWDRTCGVFRHEDGNGVPCGPADAQGKAEDQVGQTAPHQFLSPAGLRLRPTPNNAAIWTDQQTANGGSWSRSDHHPSRSHSPKAWPALPNHGNSSSICFEVDAVVRRAAARSPLAAGTGRTSSWMLFSLLASNALPRASDLFLHQQQQPSASTALISSLVFLWNHQASSH